MPYRLIAIDLDGTLLNTHGVVSPATGQALQRAAAAGIVLAPATARWYQAAVRPFEALGLRVAAIASAGSDIRGADGTVLVQDPLPTDFAAFVADLCDRAGWPATLAVPSKAYRRANELPPWAANAPEWLKPVTHLSGLLAVLAEPQPGDPYLHELEAWRGRVSMHSAVAFNGDGMVTLTAPGVDKGSGLLALCRSLGIDPSEAVAIGDSEVDIPMFPIAGLAVAVESGTPEARAAAHRLIPSPDDDGIALLIDELLAGP
jgi:hydroxymethylpyrimidine pyrophosphatase-like HAD family hydrolase